MATKSKNTERALGTVRGRGREGAREIIDPKKSDTTAEDEKRLNLAFKLVKEAVTEAGVKDASEYWGTPEYFLRYWAKNEEDAGKVPSKWPDRRWSVFKAERTHDIILLVQVNERDGIFWIETPLVNTAAELLDGANNIVTAPKFAEVMGLSAPEEVTREIENNVREVLRHYIDYLPLMMAQASERARDDSIERQVTTSIEPRLREYCRTLGLPTSFSLSVDWNRHSYANQLDTFRGTFLGRVRPKITKGLPAEYDSLRQEYKKARKYYDDTKRAFLELKKGEAVEFERREPAFTSEEKWDAKWRRDSWDEFPKLGRYLLLSFGATSDTASELALKHLATDYDRGPEYIRKRVSQLRPKRKGKKASR